MPRLLEFTQHHPYLIGAAVLLVVAILADAALRRFRKFQEVGPAQAVLLVNKGATVVDLRSAGEFKAGHIIGARNLPAEELDTRVAELDRYKAQPLVLACKTGAASESAAARLAKQGFQVLHILKGGIAAWQQDHFPLERD